MWSSVAAMLYAIACGLGGQPGTHMIFSGFSMPSFSRISSRGWIPPRTAALSCHMPPPQAHEPMAMTIFGLPTLKASTTLGRACSVTGPVTTNASACLGDSTSFTPNLSGS